MNILYILSPETYSVQATKRNSMVSLYIFNMHSFRIDDIQNQALAYLCRIYVLGPILNRK